MTSGATPNDDIEFPRRREGESMDDFMARVGGNSNVYEDLNAEERATLDQGIVGTNTNTITGDVRTVQVDTGTYDEYGLDTSGSQPGPTNTSGSPTPMDIQDRTRGRGNNNTTPASEIASSNQQAAPANAQALDQAASSTPANSGASPSDADWNTFYKEVDGRHNLLHDFNTYNYVLTITALSKDQLKNPATYRGKTFNAESGDFYIIARSGGFEKNGSNEQPPRDLYIENLVFDTRIGINDMGNSNLTRGSFEIIEPHGVGGFYEELWTGSRFAGHENYIQAPFLLTIHFVGRKAGEDTAIIPDKTTRHLPFMFTGSQMSVDEGGARYTVEFMGYNSIAAGLTRSSLWDDIQPYVNPAGESVAGILYSTFYENTNAYREVLEGIKSGLNDEQKSEIEAKIGDAEIVSRAAAGGTSNVGAWIPNEYYVWFAEGYSGSFPKTAAELSANKGKWKSHVERMLGQALPPSQSDQNLSDPAFQNRFGRAGLNDATTPSSAINVSVYESALQEANDNLNRINRQVSSKKRQIDTYIRIINRQRESLARLQEGTYGDPNRDRETDLVQDLTVGGNTKADELLSETQKVTDEGIQLAISLAGNGPDPVPPANTNLSPDELAAVVLARDQLKLAQEEIVKLSGELADLETQKEAAQQAVDDVRAQGREGYNLGASGVRWNFRKGASLFGVIDTMIINSQVMDQFQNEGQLNAMANSEYIPWYKTEIVPNIIGFDVATMNFVYEFHYIISPYSVHYSKMPGVNIIFSTDRLRELAVREYNYIYTGKNIDVLKFDIKYNNLFQTPLLLSPPSESSLQGQRGREQVVNSNIPENSYEEAIDNLQNKISNHLGTTGFTPAQAVEKMNYRDLEITNRSHIGLALKEFLENPPAELALIRADVEIIGDPVYIVGSGIAERPVLSNTDILTPDGEVNGFTREPDVIFKFRFPDDLPSNDQLKKGVSQQKIKEGAYNGLYQVIGVENRFSEGAFTQRLQLLRRKNQVQDYKVDNIYKTQGIDNLGST